MCRGFLHMPTPRPNESEADFVSRCMGDAESVADFPDESQRAAFCYSTYEQSENVTLATHAIGPMRDGELMGRRMRVIPAVMVQEQVLQNNLGATFLPRDEIAASVDAWNGMPVVLRHPTNNGQPVSARTEDTLNARGLGMVLNARADGGKLKADLYLDMERIEAIPDARAMMERFAAGETGELSTGFGTRLERAEGAHNGRRYNAIMRDLRPDHLALLPDERGACSVTDGCGLGVNAEQEMDDDRMPGWFARVWASLARSLHLESDMTRDEMLAALAAKSDCELRAMLSEPETAEEVAEPVEAAEAPEATEEVAEEATDETAELRARVAELEAELAPRIEAENAERTKLADALAANSRCAFTADELADKPLAELQKLDAMLKPESYAGRPAPRAHNRSEPLTHMPVRPYWDNSNEVN